MTYLRLRQLKPRTPVLKADRIVSLASVTPDTTERLRGRRGVERRKRWLQDHPLCAACDADGITTAGTTPDHVIPLSKGGADDESNLQTLCDKHHAEKTASEAAERARR